MTYLNTLFIKSSLNPMLIAGDSFKDLVGTEFTEFIPGTAEMTGQSLERLNRYNELLSSHPLIKLRLTGYADDTMDTPAILKQLMEVEAKRAEEENKKRETEWQKEKDALEKLRRQQREAQGGTIVESDIPIEPLKPFTPVLPKSVTVSRGTLQDLAAQRAYVVADYLRQSLSIPEDRIEITDNQRDWLKNDGSHTRVTIGITDMYGSAK